MCFQNVTIFLPSLIHEGPCTLRHAWQKERYGRIQIDRICHAVFHWFFRFPTPIRYRQTACHSRIADSQRRFFSPSWFAEFSTASAPSTSEIPLVLQIPNADPMPQRQKIPNAKVLHWRRSGIDYPTRTCSELVPPPSLKHLLRSGTRPVNH